MHTGAHLFPPPLVVYFVQTQGCTIWNVEAGKWRLSYILLYEPALWKVILAALFPTSHAEGHTEEKRNESWRRGGGLADGVEDGRMMKIMRRCVERLEEDERREGQRGAGRQKEEEREQGYRGGCYIRCDEN